MTWRKLVSPASAWKSESCSLGTVAFSVVEFRQSCSHSDFEPSFQGWYGSALITEGAGLLPIPQFTNWNCENDVSELNPYWFNCFHASTKHMTGPTFNCSNGLQFRPKTKNKLKSHAPEQTFPGHWLHDLSETTQCFVVLLNSKESDGPNFALNLRI